MIEWQKIGSGKKVYLLGVFKGYRAVVTPNYFYFCHDVEIYRVGEKVHHYKRGDIESAKQYAEQWIIGGDK